jgi:hypothetical protein
LGKNEDGAAGFSLSKGRRNRHLIDGIAFSRMIEPEVDGEGQNVEGLFLILNGHCITPANKTIGGDVRPTKRDFAGRNQ